MVAEIAAAIALLLGSAAEMLHARRSRRVAPLVFGPSGRPRLWATLSPILRVLALAAIAWGAATLLLVPPKVFRIKAVEGADPRHLVIVLDVSPSMRLQDAGHELKQSRTQRAAALVESFFKRVVMEHIRLTVVATYTGAKPVVIDTKDVDVVRNILDDLPLDQGFERGTTILWDGLREAARIAQPWKAGSATLLVISDGDTVPATGMPRMPPSISESLVVGLGDPRAGKFIDGHLSRQDVSTLRQMAHRLGGVYHNGNQEHIPSEVLRNLGGIALDDSSAPLTRREYALIALFAGSLVLAALPFLLTVAGSRWRPGSRRIHVESIRESN